MTVNGVGFMGMPTGGEDLGDLTCPPTGEGVGEELDPGLMGEWEGEWEWCGLTKGADAAVAAAAAARGWDPIKRAAAEVGGSELVVLLELGEGGCGAATADGLKDAGGGGKGEEVGAGDVLCMAAAAAACL